ncbi:acetylcholine receptor subunit alpha-like 1 [Agrilus planipennis]|uniref:Acetylcholine receptor subunit alpha-like 1 n=1 Tax=Agrilus planipennis TaxID=224129 RepID=A0A1W4WH52_AGRPL|nr:acetylcholine receptor subunit alpha-like 1 [Agrilus planipennis]
MNYLPLKWYYIIFGLFYSGSTNPDSKRLYDDLLSNYNRLIRPVGNNSDRLTVKMGLRLSQLIDVNLKNQIMTTNVWVEQEWNDYKLKWNPDDYGGVETLHVPSEHIWLPDIVLYNNADGNYEVTIMTKAILHHDGKVVWKPPAIYKSFCEINVEYFPFDEQTCFMKFGSWTYDGYMIDLRHLYQSDDSNKIDVGIDLQDYYISVEWDIMKVPAVRNEKFYVCCEEPFPDIIFNITLRRKTLFYTVNLILPCVGISFLSVLVFYLPADSGEKISLSISILLSLTVFFLLLVEIIPPTSITMPLLGKYLLFTMLLCTLSVVTTIAVLNVNFRSPVTHKLAPWVRYFFIGVLPKFLFIERPKKEDEDDGKEPDSMLTDIVHMPATEKFKNSFGASFDFGIAAPSRFDVAASGGIGPCFGDPPFPTLPLSGGDDELYSPASCRTNTFGDFEEPSPIFEKMGLSDIERTIADSKFIAQHMKNKDSYENVEEDWKYVAMVLDRLFLWIFTLACVIGTALIIFKAPSLYDTTTPIDIRISKVAKKKMKLLKMVPEEL